MADRSRSKPIIVVADDDELIRLVLTAALEREGYAVAEAEDGATAVERARTVAPVAVVLDARMPGPGLSDTVTSLRSQQTDLPILIFSGHPVPPPEASEPNTLFLTKPVDVSVFLAAITQLIGTDSR